MTKYYFAYGSNMDSKQMKDRCPGSALIGPAVLDDYKLDFTIYSPLRKCGCADIIKEKGKNVWGLVYSITEDDLFKLDEFEGCPIHYRRIEVMVSDTCDEGILTYAYEVVDKKPFIKPSAHYLSIIKDAAKRFNFPSEYQKMLDEIIYDRNVRG